MLAALVDVSRGRSAVMRAGGRSLSASRFAPSGAEMPGKTVAMLAALVNALSRCRSAVMRACSRSLTWSTFARSVVMRAGGRFLSASRFAPSGVERPSKTEGMLAALVNVSRCRSAVMRSKSRRAGPGSSSMRARGRSLSASRFPLSVVMRAGGRSLSASKFARTGKPGTMLAALANVSMERVRPSELGSC